MSTSTLRHIERHIIEEEQEEPQPAAYYATNVKSPDVNPNIVFGENVPVDEHPWFARGIDSVSGEWWGCGGSLITSEFVITVKHCLYNTSSAFQIGALCHPYSPNDNCDQYSETIPAKAVYTHPGWIPGEVSNVHSIIHAVKNHHHLHRPAPAAAKAVNSQVSFPIKDRRRQPKQKEAMQTLIK